VKLQLFPLEPILTQSHAYLGPSLSSSRQSYFDRAIKQQCEIRLDPLANQLVKSSQRLKINPAAITLIRKCRVGMPITKNDFALLKRRNDYFMNVLRAICQIKK
jgi:hypothetical protein